MPVMWVTVLILVMKRGVIEIGVRRDGQREDSRLPGEPDHRRVEGGAAHRCGLLDEPLSAADSEMICVEHDAAA